MSRVEPVSTAVRNHCLSHECSRKRSNMLCLSRLFPRADFAGLSLLLVALILPSFARGEGLHDALTVPAGPLASAASPFGAAVLQGPTPLTALDPVDLCIDPSGSLFGVPALYVVDLNAGQTYVHAASDLSLLGTIPNPGGSAPTTGITTNGSSLFWAVSNQLYQTAMDGSSPTALGTLLLPGGGQAAGLCLDGSGDLWVVDNINDQYSRHSPTDGSYLGDTLANPNGSGVFGTGIAYRSDCSLLAVPHGSLIDGQVTNISTISPSSGQLLSTTPVGFLGTFITGVEAIASSPTFTVPTLFVIENASRVLYEIPATDPCPTPAADCHDVFQGGLSFSFEASPQQSFTASPGAVISSTLPVTSSQITVMGVTDPVRDVSCQIAVTHTFVGDLDITLTDPSGGATVHLFDSAGGSADGLSILFDDEGRSFGPPFNSSEAMQPAGGSLGSSALSIFDNVVADGAWTLEVADNFTGEDGILDSWELRFDTATLIPDNDPAGVVASVLVDSETEILDLDVDLAVEHPDIGDLTIELRSPQATTITLHAQSDSGTAGLDARFDDDPLLMGTNDGFGDRVPDGPGVLADFDGEQSNGVWEVTIVDSISGEAGALTRLNLLLCGIPCPTVEALTCDSDCTTGDVTLTWSSPRAFDSLEVLRDGVPIASLVSGDTTFTDVALSKGIYEYAVRANCAPGFSVERCLVYHAPLGTGQHVIFAGELPFGQTDSVSALSNALVANGADPVIIADLAYPCLGSLGYGSVLWVCLGTFPHNFVLSPAEGSVLLNQLQQGMSIYFESADAFAFDPATSFSDYDGVENGTADDGDDNFTGMSGLAFGDLDLSGLAASYAQDQFEVDYTDQLLPTGSTPFEPEDLGGGSAGLIWQDDDEFYGTGVYYETDPLLGRVISQSWEFGGYGGDHNALAASYLSVLPVEQPFIQFIRGDCNASGQADISDAVFLLSTLFPPLGMDPPSIECRKACDSNNSDMVDISDAVTLLSALFLPDMPLPAPYPGCGVDADMDVLPCDTFGGCP